MIAIRVKTSADKPAGIVGRIFLSLFFLVFAGMGLLFVVLMLGGVWDEWRSRGWPETPCRILESGVTRERTGEGDYQFTVRYEYRWEGRLHESTCWRLKAGGFRDYGEAPALADRFPAGRDGTCRVNPGEPTAAILETGSLWPAVFVSFPLIFVAIGVGGMFFTWRESRSKTPAPAPLSAAAGNAKKSSWILVPFFRLFFVVGCARGWKCAGWPPRTGASGASAVRCSSRGSQNSSPPRPAACSCSMARSN